MANKNLLFIMCDDLNLAIGPYGGHPQTITPNLDRLASSSTVFENGYCNSPLCGPSRASLFSGFYPHTSEKFAFDSWDDNPVLSRCNIVQQHFRNHGFQVWGTGKLLHSRQENHPSYHDHGYSVELGPWPDKGDHQGRPFHPDLSFLFDGEEDFSQYWKWEATFGPLSKVPDWSTLPDQNRKPGWYLRDQPFRYINDNDRDLMPDEENSKWAADKILNSGNDPFSLFVGFNRPHTPLYAPKKYFDKFPLDQILIPDHFEEKTDHPAAITQELYAYARRRFNLYNDHHPDGIKAFIQAYLACVNFIDDQVGVLLDALDQSGREQDTMVVFTSDNGYHIGEKGLTFKSSLYDESCRIPFMIRNGGQDEGRRCQRKVSLIDLYPTFCEAFGLDNNPNPNSELPPIDGNSLMPLLNSSVNESLRGESIANIPTTQIAIDKYGPEIGPAHFTLLSEGLKFNLFGNGEEELFDLDQDPHELKNLAHSPEWNERKNILKAKLMAKTPDWFLKVQPKDWEERKWAKTNVR